MPLRLSCLDIPFACKWFQDNQSDKFQKAVLAKHPETSIDEISARFHVSGDEKVFNALPSQLHHFQGLKSFSMTIPDNPSNPSIRSILANINCPRLERIKLHGIEILGSGDCPGENLPNLKIFEVIPPFSFRTNRFNRFLGNEGVVEDIWELFKRLMAKEIKFRYGYGDKPRLNYFVCLSGRQDSDFVLQWLVQCDFHIKLYDRRFSLETLLRLDLTGCDSRSRNKVLIAFSLLEINNGLNLWIDLYDHDSLYTVELLPRNVVHLTTWFKGTFPLTLIPDIARRMKRLRYLYILELPNGWSLRMSCIKDGLRFPNRIEVQGNVPKNVVIEQHCFSLSEGWTVTMKSESHKLAEVAPNLDFGELETEVRWLCSLSSTLNEVCFRVTS